MRNFFARLFAGKRGPDAVALVLFVVGLVLSVIAWFTQNQVLGWLVYLPWLLAVLRMFSTDLERRYQENRRFLDLWSRFCGWVKGLFAPKPRMRVADAADYHHFCCPACSQKLRVPRGRGKVMVTCPKCGRTFIEKA